MRIFIRKIFLFSLLPVLYVLIATLLDPFGIIYETRNSKMKMVKTRVARKVNVSLLRLQQFTFNPADIVLLGDSRTELLKSTEFEKISGDKTINLAFGGETLPELFETFWFITSNHEIKKIYIGINFDLFNENNNMNRVKEAVKLKKSHLNYLISRYSFRSVYYMTQSLFSHKKVETEVHRLSRDEFWNQQLQSSAANLYSLYKYPYSYEKELNEISQYCRDNNIELAFVILPTHVDLQNKIEYYHLENESHRFKEFISNLNKTYDFDYANTITSERNNFVDPFHVSDSISNIVVRNILENNVKYPVLSTSLTNVN